MKKTTLQKKLELDGIHIEELDGIHIDDIGNSEDSTRLKFINEECRDFKVVNDSGELTRNIN